MSLTVATFKKGDSMGPMMVAGEDCERWSAFGIEADVFDCGDKLQVPVIFNAQPGGGKLDDFLDLMLAHAKKPLVFVSVLNAGLARHLEAKGIATMEAPADWEPA